MCRAPDAPRAQASVTLDRAQRKRCEVLKIEKPFKDRPGTFEQIFFRTEQGVRAHRTSGRAPRAACAARGTAARPAG